MAKILHLTSTLATAGAETMMVSLITSDSSNTHIVCSIYPGGAYKEKLGEKGIRTISLNMTHPIFIPLAITKFFFAVLKEKPHIIHSYLFLDNIFARIVGKILGKKVICSKRDSDRKKPWFVGFANKFTAWLADVTVTNFKDGIEELKNDGIKEEKIVYVPNGKDVRAYSLSTSRKELRKQLGIKENIFVVTFTGRLVWYKGQNYLLEAFAQVVREYPNIELLLAGDGKKRQEYEELAQKLQIENKVQFLGARKDIAEILSITDLFVSPSLRDGMPGVIMEAMASKLPVIATYADGSKDLIRQNENGILVPMKNSEVLKERILELIHDEKRRKTLGENARKTIEREFTVEKMIGSYKKLYEQVII